MSQIRTAEANILSGNARQHVGDVNNHNHYPPPREDPKTYWTVPFHPNDSLVNRPDLFAELDHLLPASTTSASAALWGLGGSGKTQVALQYAFKRKASDPGTSVFWVHADSDATFARDYLDIAKAMKIDKDEKSEELKGPKLLETVRRAIESQKNWVLVIDNADDLSLFGVPRPTRTGPSLRDFVPRSPSGTILWTSRDKEIRALVAFRRDLEVKKMKEDEALELLEAASGSAVEADETTVAHQLLEALQHLPLAITQAGAYMQRTGTTLSEYLGEITSEAEKWETLGNAEFDRHRRPEVSNSILGALDVSIRHISRENRLAYTLLQTMAYFDNQDMPLPLLEAAARSADDGHDVKPKRIREAIARLVQFSFISERSMGANGKSYEMHKLMQEAVAYSLAAAISVDAGSDGSPSSSDIICPHSQTNASQGATDFAGIAVRAIRQMFLAPKVETWRQCEQYLTHAMRARDWARTWAETCDRDDARTVVDLLQQVSVFLNHRGRWREHHSVCETALAISRKKLGEDDGDTLTCMHNLATSYDLLEQKEKAEGLYKETLERRQRVLGEGHTDVIHTMRNLANFYNNTDHPAKAQELATRAIGLANKSLSDDDELVLDLQAALARSFQEQGRLHDAEQLYSDTLHLQRKILGRKHPDTLTTMSNLGSTYFKQKHYDKAEELQAECLHLCREVLGDKHPTTLSTMSNLGSTYYNQGQYAQAEKLESECLRLRREVLGDKHPETINIMSNLAWTYHRQQQYDKSEKLRRQSWLLLQKTLGVGHATTIQRAKWLADTLDKMGRHDEAAEARAQSSRLKHTGT